MNIPSIVIKKAHSQQERWKQVRSKKYVQLLAVPTHHHHHHITRLAGRSQREEGKKRRKRGKPVSVFGNHSMHTIQRPKKKKKRKR